MILNIKQAFLILLFLFGMSLIMTQPVLSEGLQPSPTPSVTDRLADYRKRADAHRQAKNFEYAIDQYKKALAIQPDDTESLFWLATLYRWTGRFEDSERLYLLLLGDHPDHSDAKIGLAYLYLYQSRIDEVSTLANEVLKKSPDHYDAQEIHGRLLERAGRFREAADVYHDLAMRRPDDREVQRRYHNNLEKSHPLLDGRYVYSHAEVLEGRGDPVPLEQIGYLTNGFELKGRLPVSDQISMTADFDHKREKLTLLELDGQPRDQTIYDFDTITGLLGLDYRPSPAWMLLGRAGVTRYDSRDTGSISEEKFGDYELQIQHLQGESEGELQFRRRPFLGRSAGGLLDFRIFTQTQGGLRYRTSLRKGWVGTFRATISDYSDDHTTFDLSTGARLHRNRKVWVLTLRKTTLQGRFLTPDLRLEFINAYSIRLDYQQDVEIGWRIASYAQYAYFEDDNQEQQVALSADYRLKKLPWLMAGIKEEADHFNREARQYNTLSIYSRTTGFLRILFKDDLHWRANLKASASLISDEGDSFYHGYALQANMDYRLPSFFRAGLQGDLRINSLDDLHQKIIGYLVIIF